MASKRHVRRKQCGDKRRFASGPAATAAASLIDRKVGNDMEPYWCSFCGHWHIGHGRARAA